MSKTKGKPRKSALPLKVYIYRENAGTDDEFLSASEDFDDIEHGTKVGIYDLCEVKVQKVTKELI